MSADLPLTRVMPLVPSVIAKYRRAVSNNEESSQYFDLISQAVDDDLQQKWEKEISAAENGRLDRPELMDIMGNQLKNGMCEAIISFLHAINLLVDTLASTKEKLLEVAGQGITSQTAWLLTSLKIEEHQ